MGNAIVPLPENVNTHTESAMIEAMSHFTPIHFLFPFLAHVLGSFVGSFIAALLFRTRSVVVALSVSILHMLGGIYMAVILPAPFWFEISDVILAYLPMGLLAAKCSNLVRR